MKAQPEIEGVNNPYQGWFIDPSVKPDVPGEFSSKNLATDAVRFSFIVAFLRYQVWLKSVLWKGRNRRNETGPYHDLGSLVNSNLILGPPFSRVPGNVESSLTSPPGPPEVYSGPQISFPPILVVKLDLQITPPPLNRFLRFQLRWIPFENTFLTTYHTSRYVQRIPRTSM